MQWSFMKVSSQHSTIAPKPDDRREKSSMGGCTAIENIGVEQVDAGDEVHEQEAAEFPVYRK